MRSRGETLDDAFAKWLDGVDCAEVTLIAHRERARALLRYFGERPLSDFAGKPGGELVRQYIIDETGGRDRGLREKFSGTGTLVKRLTYSTCRQRVNSLRLALEYAVSRRELASMPDPWPIPPAGSHGQACRARYLLKQELAAALRREVRKHHEPCNSVQSDAPVTALPTGGATLGKVLDWLLKFGLRQSTTATRMMRTEHVVRLKHFFGADRPVAEFHGSSGYRLLLEYVEKEGPDGRGIKYTSIKKRLLTLAMALKEAVKRGDLEAIPPWPHLPSDSQPRERYLTFQEYQDIRALVAPQWRIWVDIGVWTGMHSSDINSFTWAMCDLGQGPGCGPGPGPAFWLRRNTKNKKRPAWLPMPDELRARLVEAYRNSPPQDPDEVVAGKWNNCRNQLRRACRKLGIPRVAPIDFRRTCATWWLEKGGPKEALRRWLGHAVNSTMVERHYAQITPDMVDGGVQALNRAARDPGSAGSAYPPTEAPRLLRAVEIQERNG